MARRSDHTRENLKELILNTAQKIVELEGFEALTARRIATDVGYTAGTIYNIFESMDDVCLQLNARTLDVLNETLAAPPAKTPLQTVKTMAAQYMDFAHTHKNRWLMLFAHRMSDGRVVPDWYQDKIDRMFAPLETALSPLFPPHQAQKRHTTARVLWSAVHGLCLLHVTGKMPLIDAQAKPEALTALLVETFMAGLRTG